MQADTAHREPSLVRFLRAHQLPVGSNEGWFNQSRGLFSRRAQDQTQDSSQRQQDFIGEEPQKFRAEVHSCMEALKVPHGPVPEKNLTRHHKQHHNTHPTSPLSWSGPDLPDNQAPQRYRGGKPHQGLSSGRVITPQQTDDVHASSQTEQGNRKAVNHGNGERARKRRVSSTPLQGAGSIANSITSTSRRWTAGRLSPPWQTCQLWGLVGRKGSAYPY